MPFSGTRLAELREAKSLERKDLAALVGVAPSAVTKHENGDAQSVEMIERFADALDCTMDYLYERGTQYHDATDAAIQMSFDVFARGKDCTSAKRDWCRRVLMHHESPPRTANGWKILAEQIQIAVNPPQNGDRQLRAVR